MGVVGSRPRLLMLGVTFLFFQVLKMYWEVLCRIAMRDFGLVTGWVWVCWKEWSGLEGEASECVSKFLQVYRWSSTN